MLYGRAKKLYVFEYADRYKIGVSNNIKNRLNQLSCGCPNIKCIYESEYLDNPFIVESQIHKMFCEYCIGSEWFSFVDIDAVKEAISNSGKIIDIETIKDRNRKSAKKFSEIAERTFSHFSAPNDQNNESMERIAFDNMQIEKFIHSVNGEDVPNIYSDLIYDILFGENTESMVSKYSPKRFESFRAKLTEEQNLRIDKLTKVVGSLINQYWSYGQIEEFVRDL